MLAGIIRVGCGVLSIKSGVRGPVNQEWCAVSCQSRVGCGAERDALHLRHGQSMVSIKSGVGGLSIESGVQCPVNQEWGAVSCQSKVECSVLSIKSGVQCPVNQEDRWVGLESISKLGQLQSPHFACLSYDTLKVGLFYLGSIPGELKFPTQGKCVACRGLTDSSVKIRLAAAKKKSL